MRPLAFDEPGQQAMDRRQPLGERSRRVGLDRAAANEAEPRPGSLDHAPARRAQAGIDAENANHADGHGEGLIYEFPRQGILAHGWPGARAEGAIISMHCSYGFGWPVPEPKRARFSRRN